MALATDPASFAQQLNTVASDGGLDASDRVAELRRIKLRIRDALEHVPLDQRGEWISVLGQADTYIGKNELQREAANFSGVLMSAAAREDAEVHDHLVSQGIATAEQLSDAGWASHDQLDAMEQDGSLAEAAFGLGMLHGQSFNAKVKRDHGKFSTMNVGGAAKDAAVAPQAPLGVKLPEKPPVPPSSPGTEEHLKAIDSLDSVAAQLEEVRKYGLNDWPTKGQVAEKVLAGAKDTQDRWTVPSPASPGTEEPSGVPGRSYVGQRKALHDAIVGKFLAPGVARALGDDHPITQKLRSGGVLSDAEKQAIRATSAGRRPRALFMAGGPASGKTSALHAAPELEPDGAVLVNPDEIKDLIPEYRQMIEGGDKFGAAGVHEESSDVAKRLQSEAMDLGLNTVIDGTGDSKKGKFAQKMKDMDDAGYDVSALYVTIPTDAAVVRATKRAMHSGRWVPEPEIRKQHRNVSVNFSDVAALPFLKDLKLYDNSGKSPVLAAEAAGGKTRAIDQGAFDAFLSKGEEALEEAAEQPPSGGEYGEFAAEADVPVQDWIPHPVSDSAEYLDRDVPRYESEGGQ